MGGHRVVACYDPTDLSTKMVQYGPAWRVLDEQLHRRIGKASSGFDEEDSEVIRVRGEVPIPSLLVRGPHLLDPRDGCWEEELPWGSRTGMGK